MAYVLGKRSPTTDTGSSWEAEIIDDLALTSSSSEVNQGRRALPLAMHTTPGSIPVDMEELWCWILTSKERNSWHLPVCSTKNPGLVHTQGWPLCHGSLEFPVKTKTEAININLWRNKETGKHREPFQSLSWNILQRVGLFISKRKWLL